MGSRMLREEIGGPRSFYPREKNEKRKKSLDITLQVKRGIGQKQHTKGGRRNMGASISKEGGGQRGQRSRKYEMLGLRENRGARKGSLPPGKGSGEFG